MNRKGFISIILIVTIVVVVVAAGYFTFVKKSGPAILSASNSPVAPFISEQEARTIINQRGFDVSTAGTSLKLKPTNQPFFQWYTGPGSPVRIAGQYWEVRIPIPGQDSECHSARVLFIDATTGEFYDLGTSTSCF